MFLHVVFKLALASSIPAGATKRIVERVNPRDGCWTALHSSAWALRDLHLSARGIDLHCCCFVYVGTNQSVSWSACIHTARHSQSRAPSHAPQTSIAHSPMHRRSSDAHLGCYVALERLLTLANLPTKIPDFRGLDSSRILILRGGILTSIGNFPEIFESTNLSRDNQY